MQRTFITACTALLLALAPQARAATDAPIDLPTGSGTLKGSLLLPERPARPPVALIIAGSGPTDRDGNAPALGVRTDSLRLLAQALADAGIASVRYDKRGVGASAAAGKPEIDTTIDDFVGDAAAWIDRLGADPRFAGVAVVGHSEGALIGLRALQGRKVAAYVSIAGPGEPAAATLRRQLAGRLPPELAARSEAILAALEQGRTVADVPPELMALYRPSVQPYLVSWFRLSPAAEIARIGVPCLVLQGDTDVQVAPADAEALGRAQPRCQVQLVPGMNHLMKQVPASPQQQTASYGDPSLPLAHELVSALVRFLGDSAR